MSNYKEGDVIDVYELSETTRAGATEKTWSITKLKVTVSFVPQGLDRIEATLKGRRRQLFVGLPGKRDHSFVSAFLTFEDARQEALRRTGIDIRNAEVRLHSLRAQREVLEQLKEPA